MSYLGIMRTDGLADLPDLEIPARFLPGLVCAEGGLACPLFADRTEATKMLASVRNCPAATVRLVTDADRIPHYPEVQRAGGWSRLDRPALLDRKRDLAVLQRLGLAPGDTRRARYLFEHLFARVPTPRGICSGHAPGWEGCPFATSFAYERVRRSGVEAILGERSEAERVTARRESATRITEDPMLAVRPHHLMCMSCWFGDGSDLRPRENDALDLLWERILRDPDVEILLVEGNCEACWCCDGFDPGSTRCVHPGGLIRDYKKDLDLLEAIGLFPGDRMNARELLRLIHARITSTTMICGYGDGVATSAEWSVCGGPEGNRGYEAARKAMPGLIAGG